ncbi:MAG: hypothetical protein IJ679_01140 [Lachnospiraceae bacterium]|nr:hypothetical protein [Lachnospiraceae bacterium]
MRVSLLERCPKLAEEWSDKNGTLDPDQVSYGSNRKVWWKGSCGHEWEACIKNRVKGVGCPYCSGNRLLKGFNDLASVSQLLVTEWSDRNKVQPDEVIAGSPKKAFWKCGICGGEWEARIADRMNGSGCPVCSFAKIQTGINDFATWYPELAEEWSSRNGALRPEVLSAKARVKVWWKCRDCGHEWIRSTHFRAKGSGCPECHRRNVADLQRRKRKLRESFPKKLPQAAVRYYASEGKIPFLWQDDEAIGIPLMAWFPDRKGAIEIAGRSNPQGRMKIPDRIKDSLCQKAGIRLVRILGEVEEKHGGVICIRRMDGANEALLEAVKKAFEIIGYKVDADVDRDWKEIQDYYLENMLDRKMQDSQIRMGGSGNEDTGCAVFRR